MHDLSKSDLYQHLLFQKTVIEQRIEGSTGEWKTHWQREQRALLRCLWSLRGEA